MNHARRAPVLRRIALLVALVGSVVVGLLAMHTFSEHPTAAVTTTAALSEHHHAASTGSMHEHEGAAPCVDDCGGAPLHSMAVVGCVLALLILLVIVAPGAAPGGGTELRRQSHPSLRAEPSPRPHPPDLALLCISRT